jgi:hypothetical protein
LSFSFLCKIGKGEPCTSGPRSAKEKEPINMDVPTVTIALGFALDKVKKKKNLLYPDQK